MRVVLVEPFFSGSHKSWAVGVKNHSSHTIELLTLPGRHWKWRMHGGAVTLARRFTEEFTGCDLILASDMLNLCSFQALTKDKTSQTPCVLYFHENQLSYPWSEQDRDAQRGTDLHYGFINFTSALSADALAFNSEFNKRSFLEEAPKLLKQFPDYNELALVDTLESKSSVLPVGTDLSRLKQMRDEGLKFKESLAVECPIIIWNHRWEYDKNPEEFFTALKSMKELEFDFRLVVLGEQFESWPACFDDAREYFCNEILHWGYLDSFEDYATWLWAADILPVTSKHDFFGLSVLEAIYCGCYPLLPRKLSYPELYDVEAYPEYFYKDNDELLSKLQNLLKLPLEKPAKLQGQLERFNWSAVISEYDSYFKRLIE